MCEYFHIFLYFLCIYIWTFVIAFKVRQQKKIIVFRKKTEKGERIKYFNKHVSWQVAEKGIKRERGISNVVLNISEFLASI